MTASNTKDCFREFVGKRVKGVLFDAFPMGRRDLNAGSKTLVFEDGRGLTIAQNGSFWIESAEDVKRAVSAVLEKAKATRKEIKGLLALAGEL